MSTGKRLAGCDGNPRDIVGQRQIYSKDKGKYSVKVFGQHPVHDRAGLAKRVAASGPQRGPLRAIAFSVDR